MHSIGKILARAPWHTLVDAGERITIVRHLGRNGGAAGFTTTLTHREVRELADALHAAAAQFVEDRRPAPKVGPITPSEIVNGAWFRTYDGRNRFVFGTTEGLFYTEDTFGAVQLGRRCASKLVESMNRLGYTRVSA